MSKKGRTPWNKGLSAKDDERVAKSIKAAHKAVRGKPAWNKGLTKETDERVRKYAKKLKGMEKPWQADEKHHSWKGNDVSYVSLHKWIKRKKGEPKKCDNCGELKDKTKKRSNIEWANIDHKYRRSLDDWKQLCISCHRKYDCKKFGRTAWNKGKKVPKLSEQAKLNKHGNYFTKGYTPWHKKKQGVD